MPIQEQSDEPPKGAGPDVVKVLESLGDDLEVLDAGWATVQNGLLGLTKSLDRWKQDVRKLPHGFDADNAAMKQAETTVRTFQQQFTAFRSKAEATLSGPVDVSGNEQTAAISTIGDVLETFRKLEQVIAPALDTWLQGFAQTQKKVLQAQRVIREGPETLKTEKGLLT